MSQKLEVKDLINVGLFLALYAVCYFGTSFIGYIPIFMVVVPAISPVIAGIPFMLFLTRTRKFGMVTSMTVGVTILMFAMGHPWYIVVFGIEFGLLADLIFRIGNYKSVKWSVIGYAVFSEWSMGAYISMFFCFRDNYFAGMRAGYGDVYVDKLMALTPDWMYWVMAVLAFGGGILGALLGHKVLKKHFVKAGIVA